MASSDLTDFPDMTVKELNILFTGFYQFKQAISYLAEMIDESDNLNIQYVKDKTNILKILVLSRHKSSKQYRCFIEYKPNTTGCKGISRYSCEYLSRIPKPAEYLNKLFDHDETNAVIEEDSDED